MLHDEVLGKEQYPLLEAAETLQYALPHESFLTGEYFQK
jgi:hypothetical protein